MFKAFAEQLATRMEGGPDAWIVNDNKHFLIRLVELSNKWRPGDAVPVSIFVEEHLWSTISRCGDLLLGFVRLNTVTDASRLRLEIGGQDFGSVDLAPHAGAFAFAHADRFVVPIINLRFHEVRVFPFDDPSVGIVWGSTDTEERRDLCVSGAYSAMGNGVAAKYASGMGGIGPVPDAPGTLVEMPDMRAMMDKIIEDGSKERALARCDALRQDLMAATWHPGRMRRWCLDHEDEFAESDDVHVMDGFLSHEECASLLAEMGTPGPPSLVPAPSHILDLVQSRLAGTCAIQGTRCAYGDTSDGMHSHRDEAYQGGTKTLLVYLTGPGDGGGETVFEKRIRVKPVTGRAVLFSVRHIHHTEPVKGGWRKVIVAFECITSCVAHPRQPASPPQGGGPSS